MFIISSVLLFISFIHRFNGGGWEPNYGVTWCARQPWFADFLPPEYGLWLPDLTPLQFSVSVRIESTCHRLPSSTGSADRQSMNFRGGTKGIDRDCADLRALA